MRTAAQETLDASLLDTAAPGGRLMHVFGRNVNMGDSTLARERTKDCSTHRKREKELREKDPNRSDGRTSDGCASDGRAAITPPWCLHDEPDRIQLKQAWQAGSTGSVRGPGLQFGTSAAVATR